MFSESMDNYEKLVDRISKSSGLDAGEIERRVEAKKAKLSGLISKEGAAQIVAAELGLNLDKERLKLSELVQGMKRANVIAKIIEVYPVREYNKNGRAGKVANMVVADDSTNAKVVLWDTNHIALIEQGKINKGDVVEISNGNIRNGELHLSSFGDIKISNEKIENVVAEKVFSQKKLSDASAGQSLKTRAVIVQVFEPRYFEVCPECKKRALEGECKIHGKVEPLKRALISIVLDDGTSTIRSVMFGENINKLGLSDEEIFSLEKFAEKRAGLLGEEKVFLGNLKTNTLYNTTEFNIDKIEEVNIDELVKELETKVMVPEAKSN
jgi:ssDNA-binding replication factor A large subunit